METRYWLSIGDGRTYGPYPLSELFRYRAEGRLTPISQLCREGESQWQTVESVLGFGTATTTPPTSPPPPPPPASPIALDPSAKSKVAAGVLGILLGALGIHNFYLGYMGKGLAQLLLTLLSCGYLGVVSWIWGLIEGIMILTGSIAVDAQGRRLQN